MTQPLVDKFEDKTIVVKHVEPLEIKKTFEKTEVLTHQAAPIIQDHV